MSGSQRVALAGLRAADAAALASRIAAARLVCFPTDTVYGVGGALTAPVREALAAAKDRDPDKPLQVVFPSLRLLETRVELTPALRAACRAVLPGPVTLVVPYPAGWRFPPPGRVVTPSGGEVATLGVRVPDWPAAARVLRALGEPVLASSANRSGDPPPGSLDGVDPVLLASCDLVLDAGPVAGVASTVIDLTTYTLTGAWRVLRPGAWDQSRIAARFEAAGEESRP